MRKELTSLGKHTFIYTIGMLISKAVSFIMLPVYTRYLTPADYGTVELLTTTLDVVVIVTGIGLTATLFKFYSAYDDELERHEVVSTVMLMALGISLVVSIICYLLSGEFSLLVFRNNENAHYFRILFIIYLLNSSIVIPLLFIRAMQSSLLFVSINLFKLIIQLSLNIYFIVYLGKGIIGILYSTLIVDIFLSSYLFYYTFKHVGFRFSRSKAVEMLNFGYPFIFTSLSSFFLTFSDRYFLNIFTSLKTVGIYALAYKFGFLMGYLAVGPFMQIWEPRRFEISKMDNAGSIFRRVFFYFNIIIITISLFLCLFIKDVLTIMSDPAYIDAYKVAPPIILAYLFQAWTNYCNIGLYIKDKSDQLSIASVISAVFVLVGNMILIPGYGIYGAALATVATFFLRFLLVNYLSQKLYHVAYAWSKIIYLLATAFGVFCLSRILSVENILASLAVNTIYLLGFITIIYTFFLNTSEKTRIKEIMNTPLLSYKHLFGKT